MKTNNVFFDGDEIRPLEEQVVLLLIDHLFNFAKYDGVTNEERYYAYYNAAALIVLLDSYGINIPQYQADLFIELLDDFGEILDGGK